MESAWRITVEPGVNCALMVASANQPWLLKTLVTTSGKAALPPGLPSAPGGPPPPPAPPVPPAPPPAAEDLPPHPPNTTDASEAVLLRGNLTRTGGSRRGASFHCS